MKNGWQIKELSAVCEIMNGGTPKTGVPEFWDGNNLWITPAEMGKRLSPYVSDTERKLTDLGLRNSSAQMLPPKSIILSSRAPIGHLVINTKPMATNQGCKGLIPGDKIHYKFLYYYLSSIVDLLNSLGTGATFKELSGGKLKGVTVPVPSLTEQQRIVGILDEAFEGIATAKANAEKNLQNARALFDSYLQSVFTQRGAGYKEKKLSEVCAITSTLIDPRKAEFLDLIHVGAGNIESQTGAFVELKTAREEGLISGKFLFDESMVLYSKIRPYLMKVARPDFRGLCSADMYPLAPLPNEITRDYLFHLLLSKGFTDYAIQGSARAGMPKVNRDHLFEFRVWLPNVKKQTELAAKLDELHKETQRLESIYQQKLVVLEELKKSILHQAFKGELIKETRSTLVVPFPARIPDISTTDLEVGILAMGYDLHEKNNRLQFYGHVKAEKTVHMVESYLGIDLERKPFKEAAGPNDYPRLKAVESRAKKAGYFHFQQNGTRYQFTKYRRFDELVQRTREKLGERANSVDELLKLMLPMDTQQAEIFCTVYAAWNNLLLDGHQPTDEEIVFEARENWHPDKLLIPRERFFGAIDFLKEKNMVPLGRGKKVLAKVKKK